MESFKLNQRVGKDGTLRIYIPIGAPNQDVEAVVTYQLARSARTSQPSLESLYGICADDLIVHNKRGISDTLEDNMNGAFK
jgi:hypothetical protein